MSLDAIIGRSETILSLKRLIESVAQSDATVLVIGESGTGKELVARALHDHSQRAAKRFEYGRRTDQMCVGFCLLI